MAGPQCNADKPGEKKAGRLGIPPFLCEAMEKRLTDRIIILLLVITVLGVYYQAIFAPLNYIDDLKLVHYLLNTDSFSFRQLFLPGGSGTYYRPLLKASFLLDKYVWGLEESFMHLQNIVLHLANTLLVFAIARRTADLLKITSPVPVLLAPFFFAVHPINAEAVNWISARTDLLAGFFVFLSLFLVLRHSLKFSVFLVAVASFLLACLAKETAVFLLPALLILPLCLPTEGASKESIRITLARNIPFFVAFISAGCGYFFLRLLAFSRGDSGVARVVTHVVGEESGGVLVTLRLVLKAAGFYLKKLFIPFPLNFGTIHVSDLYIIPGVVLFIVLIVLLKRRTLPAFFFLSAASVGASALMIPLLRVAWTPLAERYMYIPSAFFLLGLVFAGYRWAARVCYSRYITAVVGCLAIVAIFGTSSRTLIWQDNLALFRDTMEKSPDFLPAQNEYAHALYEQGKKQEAAAMYKSIKVTKHIINYQYGYMNKAMVLAREGDYDGARKILRETLAEPGKQEVEIIQRILKLNELEVKKGLAEKGEFYGENVVLLTRLRTITGDPFYFYRLGQEHLFHGDNVKACEAFKEVVARAPQKMYYRAAAEKLLKNIRLANK